MEKTAVQSSPIQVQFGKPALVLAPMEGLIDAPMRAFFSERGGFSFCVSEFFRITKDVPPTRAVIEHVPELEYRSLTPSGVPIQVQLLGGDPGRLAESALISCRAGATAIDLNFGCPSPTVNKHDGGATLLKYPNRIKSIVSRVRQELPAMIPVSAKLRLGWDDPKAIFLNAEMAAAGGASWITIHGRTRLQGYTPPAYWKAIGEVRKSLSIPVIANGEIWTLDDFKRCRDETQCEHFMIGRGALARPSLPLEIANELKIPSVSSEQNNLELNWAKIIEKFAELGLKYTDRPGYLPCRIKQWARIIHQRSPMAWYDLIKPLNSWEEIRRALYEQY